MRCIRLGWTQCDVTGGLCVKRMARRCISVHVIFLLYHGANSCLLFFFFLSLSISSLSELLSELSVFSDPGARQKDAAPSS